MPTTAQCIGPPIPAGATAQYMARLYDEYHKPIPASALVSLQLSIVDTVSGAVVNNVNGVSILNVGRGTVDQLGNVTVNLLTSDTALTYPAYPLTRRTLLFVAVYNGGNSTALHASNFLVEAPLGGGGYAPPSPVVGILPYYLAYGGFGTFGDILPSEWDGNYVLFDNQLATNLTLPANLVTSPSLQCLIPPASSVTLTLQWIHDNVAQNIGMAQISAGSFSGAYSTGGVPYIIPSGDRIRLIAPPDVDKTVVLTGVVVGSFGA